MSDVFLTGRRTVYNGTLMRSRLEARFARLFDLAHISWTYEPQCFADETGEYLPDFLLGGHTYAEIKPPLTEPEIRRVRQRMQIIRSSQPEAALWIIHLQPDYGFSIDHSHQPDRWDRWYCGPDDDRGPAPLSALLAERHPTAR